MSEIDRITAEIEELRATVKANSHLPIDNAGIVSLNNQITALIHRLTTLEEKIKSNASSQEVPTTDCTTKLVGHEIADINQAFKTDLGFKIPLESFKYVKQFPSVFELGEWTHSGSVLSWIQHNLVGDSEHSVISLDSAWEGILQGFLQGLTFYRDQHDPSSLPRERPDLTVVYNHCIVLKSEAIRDEKDMGDAELSLTTKFKGNAYKMFPMSSTIIGVCSSKSLIKIFKVFYNHELNQYESLLFPNASYRVDFVEQRVRFLVDIVKLLKWIYTVRPLETFHLVPNVRTPTNNHHYVTWNGISIIKEFVRNKNIDLQHIKTIYTSKLPNVEYGEVLENTYPPSIRIDRIGRPLKVAIANGFSKELALQHVEAGIQQLRSLNLGHGDISLNNIFVDDQNIAFLDDLEYAAPLGHIIPKERRPTDQSNVRKIEDFDAWRFGQLRVEIERL
eukprot:gene4147-4439_t